MEELEPGEIEDLLQELEGKSGAQEPLSPDVEELLRELEPGRSAYTRSKAAEQLGRVDTSSPRIVQALLAARDANSLVREAAAKALSAPVHEAVLQEHPDLIERAESALEQAAIQREKQREKQRAVGTGEVHDRKEPKVGGWIPAFIVFGIVWVVVSGIATTSNQWDFWCFPFVALPGVAVVALALWRWRAATINHEALLCSIKQTVGTVEALRKSESDSDYGSTTYYVSVRFEAEDAKMGMRVMELKAQVAHRLWTGMNRGDAVHIRYAAEDPRIALIEGEW